ncbi:PAS domain-containing protein [Halorubrum sp. CBA1125]|uniref:histidine kinase N-terminal 7TM domain-containing protein n=1 Tax=Halorubrum sp. CBA1125 TaxID=2668072 RepID=UPI0012E899CB|nr:histidine kinase N-terminal 7TM domain-containing protein [Halorubrum sp. CBA1125]MUW15420.1 PAS domain-containing protein [Halorubrum sp. CBA1125]
MALDALSAWPAAGSIAGGTGAIGLAWALRRHRGRLGVDWFLGVFAAQATWCLSYGIGLLVADRTVRAVLEATMWLGVVWTGIAFLGFALAYTGRGDVIRSRLFAAVVGFGLVSTLLLATNGVHGAFWTDFRIDPVFGVATVSYAFGPWASLVVAVESVLVASGVFLLVDTLLSYGPLYRRESAAVALSSLPPGIALVAWALGVGPAPQLQLAPVMFVPHVLLDAYAFGRAEMFDRHPTTSRAAERTAVDDLADPIVVVATDGRIVRLNPAAEALLGVSESSARDRPLDAFLDVSILESGDDDGGSDARVPPEAVDAEIEIATDRGRRTYAVSTSPLSDPSGTHVGHTVVFSDVTERERRRQQLEVLNRVLRHNLRNDAGVVHGYGELLAERLDDPELGRMADAIERRAGALAALGEKAGTVDDLLAEEAPASVDVPALVEAVAARSRETVPDATVEVDVGADVGRVRLRATALRALVENLIENGLEHHDGKGTERTDGGPWVAVTVAAEPDALVVTVADDGPGIPPHEVEAVESGRETALEHGSGLGLWVVAWAADDLGADVDYAEREPRGTTVTVTIPVADGS